MLKLFYYLLIVKISLEMTGAKSFLLSLNFNSEKIIGEERC